MPYRMIPDSTVSRELELGTLAPEKSSNLSAYFLWVGDRAGQLDGAHVEYFRVIRNPIGIKVGPSMVADELVFSTVSTMPENCPPRYFLRLIRLVKSGLILSLFLRLISRPSDRFAPSIISEPTYISHVVLTVMGTTQHSRIVDWSEDAPLRYYHPSQRANLMPPHPH
jgi:Class-II DAHP synthetase family